MKRRFILIIGPITLTLAIFSSAYSSVKTVYGPEDFSVGKGKPVTVNRTFEGTNGSATLTLVNGTAQGNNSISTGWVTLNGMEIFSPSDFNQQVDVLAKKIVLRHENNLNVQVIGTVGHFINLTITSESADPLPVPTASLDVSPSEISSGELATLSWTTSEAEQAIIEPGIGEVLLVGSMQVSPEQTTAYRLSAIGLGGEASAKTTVTVNDLPPPPIFGITFDPYRDGPLDGNTVNNTQLLVSGTVSVPYPEEIGVSVNGIVAEMSNGRFSAKILLQEGSNTITAVATDANGPVCQASAQVYSLPASDYVSLTADTSAGIIPINVELAVSADISNNIASYDLTCTGPTIFTPATSGEDTFQASFTLPGLYICRFVVVDETGSTFDDSIIVNAYQNTELNTLLQQKWSAMTAAMAQSDVEAMMPYFLSSARKVQARRFGSIVSKLPQMATDMRGISLLKVEDKRAICDLRLVKDGTP